MASFLFYIAWIASLQAIVSKHHSKLSNTDANCDVPCYLSKLNHIGGSLRLGLTDSNKTWFDSSITQFTASSFTEIRPNRNIHHHYTALTTQTHKCHGDTSPRRSHGALLIQTFKTEKRVEKEVETLLNSFASLYKGNDRYAYGFNLPIAQSSPVSQVIYTSVLFPHRNCDGYDGATVKYDCEYESGALDATGTKPKRPHCLPQSVSTEERETPPHPQAQRTMKGTLHSKEHDAHQIRNVYDASATSFSLFHLCLVLSSIIFIIYLNKQIKRFAVITVC
eukprot:391886_1